jgi:hypothetical protein
MPWAYSPKGRQLKKRKNRFTAKREIKRKSGRKQEKRREQISWVLLDVST